MKSSLSPCACQPQVTLHWSIVVDLHLIESGSSRRLCSSPRQVGKGLCELPSYYISNRWTKMEASKPIFDVNGIPLERCSQMENEDSAQCKTIGFYYRKLWSMFYYRKGGQHLPSAEDQSTVGKMTHSLSSVDPPIFGQHESGWQAQGQSDD
ncbi:hypothetical protein Cgig2_019820 [Carnegiea gigantea]|uniref:Uncharacterized protein n=1 Tax=Carnegiea gigantea TaxID=171969 RepID=A0A9Q1Q9Y3_9CARY|nr:hypothetical protein Cgig2_019820 [Carnegiea gigantea]